MSQNKLVLIFVMSLLLCNPLDAMKRQREGETQEIVVVIPPKTYWDGEQPYDGSMVIKATLDHDCRHCKERITGESLAAHAFAKHSDLYPKVAQQQLAKKRKIQSFTSSTEESGSSFEFSDSSTQDSGSSCESSDSSVEIQKNNNVGFVTKVWKSGHTVQHVVCGQGGCRFSSGRIEEMSNHKKLHGVDDCSVCKSCHFRAVSKRVFINHTQTHLPKEKRVNTATCSVCNKTLSKNSSLRRHMESQHS